MADSDTPGGEDHYNKARKPKRARTNPKDEDDDDDDEDHPPRVAQQTSETISVDTVARRYPMIEIPEPGEDTSVPEKPEIEEREAVPGNPADQPIKKKRKRRPPLVPWKKPKDMPRRPLSAYNIFFKEQRELMLSGGPEGESGGDATRKRARSRRGKSPGIGFANLAKTIATKWNELDSDAKAPYENQAAQEKERYTKEMAVWRAKQKEEKERATSSQETMQYSGILPIPAIDRDDIGTYVHPSSLASVQGLWQSHDAAEYVARRHPSHLPETSADFSPIRLPDSNTDQWMGPQAVREALAHRPVVDASGAIIPVSRRGAYGMTREKGAYAQRRRDLSPNANANFGTQLDQQSLSMRTAQGMASSSYPASWSELEVPQEYGRRSPLSMMQSMAGTQHPQLVVSGQASYPETWFEVQATQEGEREEFLEYSRRGDISGKLPARKPSPEIPGPSVRKDHFAQGITDYGQFGMRSDIKYKPGSQQRSTFELSEMRARLQDEGPSWKYAEDPAAEPVMRSDVEDPLRTGKFTDPFGHQGGDPVQERAAALAQYSSVAAAGQQLGSYRTSSPNFETSLQALGRRLDHESFDFLTSLRFNSPHETPPSDGNGHSPQSDQADNRP